MDVRKAIDDLRSALVHITAEQELLGVVDDRLTALRQAYPSHRSLFAPGDIDFLKSLGAISDHLRAFIELKEELAGISSLQEYEDISGRLTRAKDALAAFPVGRRVAKEIRELNEKLPAIREQDDAQRQFRLNGRIHDLQQNPRLCPRGHPMVIREGARGHFWACSRFPFCDATAQLTREERDLLSR